MTPYYKLPLFLQEIFEKIIMAASDAEDDSSIEEIENPKNELDNLFGAFDEAGSGSEDEDGEVEEEEDDDEVQEVAPSKVGDISKKYDDDDEVIVVEKPSPKTIPLQDSTPLAAEEEEEEKKETVIATGTSHDKSIRSYSAIPTLRSKSSTTETSTETTKEPAKVYPFELDPFQQRAIEYVEKGESVLVAAHTSAGKTVVAEYAIAVSLRDQSRVIYTSPIKALSNQKFRDLQSEFGDDNVGLMTGDITINPTAPCLVMTTEILRSMLYRGSEVMREVAWVIYDEVHYMRDADRGVVWEESIILLPHKVRFVFLSATIPNARQFVQWIAKIHTQPCHVVYTNYRPTPLQHYIFPAKSDGLHLVVDEKGKFRESNFQKAMSTLQNQSSTDESTSASSGNKRKRGGGGSAGKQNQVSDLYKIVKLIMQRNLHPVIIFSFSKKDCEKYAIQLNGEDFNSDSVEKDLITQVYNNALESLSADDRTLPQVEALLPLLKKGIGIHHGGLLPILKEIVEILFSEGLVKVLFATETFAIGINMPAKTVVFTNTRKWDGTDFRWVSSGEYIQMSGRAGRRGKDDRGIVIQMMDEKMEPSVCKSILYGDPDPLNSSYKISYNMLLNMMRVEDVDPEYLLRASFHQFQQESNAPSLLARAQQLESQAASYDQEENGVADYYGLYVQSTKMQEKCLRHLQQPQYMSPYLQQPGRMLQCTIQGESFGWGVLLNYKRRTVGSAGMAGKLASSSSKNSTEYTIDVLLPCVDRKSDESTSNETLKKMKEDVGMLWRGTVTYCRPVTPKDDTSVITHRIFTTTLQSIDSLSAIRLFIPKTDVKTESGRKQIRNSMQQAQSRFPNGIPILDPIKDMKVKSSEYKQLLERQKTLQQRLSSHQLLKQIEEEGHDDVQGKLKSLIAKYGKKVDLLDEARVLRKEAQSSQGMVMREELKKMKRVLRQLGHVDAHGVIQTKGRTACEINTANELVVVELMFSGVLNDLSVEQCVALLSCLIFDEKKGDDDGNTNMKSYLSNPFTKLQNSARIVAKAIIACKMELDEDEFVDGFNPGM